MKSPFEILEPPPGGLTRLKAAMAAERRVLRVWQPVLAGALALVLIAFAFFARSQDRADLVGGARDSVFGASPVPVVVRGDAAALRLPTSNPKVVFYRVAMLDPSLAPPVD